MNADTKFSMPPLELNLVGYAKVHNSVSESSPTTIYTWDTRGKLFEAILSLLVRSGRGTIRVCDFSTNSAKVVELINSESPIPNFMYPFVRIDGALIVDPLELESFLLQSTRVTLPSIQPALTFESSIPTSLRTMSPPLIAYLDKPWKWSVLMLNLIETFGSSVHKTASDPSIPEEFLVDCMKRNLGIETLKDCRMLIYELTNNGILEEVGQDEYKFTYHLNYYALNANREFSDPESETPAPPIDQLVELLLHLLSRTMAVHSVAFLEFVDHLSLFSRIEFSSTLSRPVLVKLHSIMAHHIDCFGVLLESERNKFYYKFANKPVHLSDLRAAIRKASQPKERESIEAALYLKWTLSGDPEVDEQIMRIARDQVVAATVRAHGRYTYIPSFLRSVKGKWRKYYSLLISPF